VPFFLPNKKIHENRGFFYDSINIAPIKNTKTNAAAILNVIDNSSILTPPLSLDDFIVSSNVEKSGLFYGGFLSKE